MENLQTSEDVTIWYQVVTIKLYDNGASTDMYSCIRSRWYSDDDAVIYACGLVMTYRAYHVFTLMTSAWRSSRDAFDYYIIIIIIIKSERHDNVIV